jgi:hypothetical protein
MRSALLVLLAMAGIARAGERVPVVLELFTSEGCSSCPPAEALLEQIDRKQPITGVNAIVMAEHVDYWDNLGWRDPYASQFFTLRQDQYGRLFRLDSVYTPQMVVDGAIQVAGGDVDGILAAMRKSAAEPAVPVKLALQPDGRGVAVDIPAAPDKKGVFLAIADDSVTTKVLRGENAGHELHHVAVIRSIQKIGIVSRSAGFSGTVPLEPHGGQRIIVFLQDNALGRIAGAAMVRYPSTR